MMHKVVDALICINQIFHQFLRLQKALFIDFHHDRVPLLVALRFFLVQLLADQCLLVFQLLLFWIWNMHSTKAETRIALVTVLTTPISAVIGRRAAVVSLKAGVIAILIIVIFRKSIGRI